MRGTQTQQRHSVTLDCRQYEDASPGVQKGVEMGSLAIYIIVSAWEGQNPRL